MENCADQKSRSTLPGHSGNITGRKLTVDEAEQFFFVTGSEIGGVMVLDQWAEFAHQKRSVMGVVMGLVNAFGNLGGFVGPYIVGWLAKVCDCP